jgi:hypothetical protein
MDKTTQTFKVTEDYANNKDEFETTLAYMEYIMRKHINDTIETNKKKSRSNLNKWMALDHQYINSPLMNWMKQKTKDLTF